MALENGLGRSPLAGENPTLDNRKPIPGSGQPFEIADKKSYNNYMRPFPVGPCKERLNIS
jgi:hypothetical protein